MQRTYLPLLGLGLGLAAALQGARAASVFSSQELDASRFAILAQPLGRSDWKLLVLEQIQPEPRCWQERADGLIDPSLNRFDFSGICSRYIDSNGYSLRVADEDLASRYRLRLEQQGTSLRLLAMSPSQPTELLVGRGTVSQRDKEGFVALQLEGGWQLQRRAYGSQTLSHLYFAHATPLAQLIAQAEPQQPGSRRAELVSARQLPPLASSSTSSGPISLEVVPYRP